MSVVVIEPTELGFRRPLTVEVSETLRIKNPNATPVAFKVKTTAPKQYCVRPNSGRIEPDREVEVTVLLQAMKQDPPDNFKCRDKFLVQAVPITNDKVFTGVQEIWDKVDKADIEEKKIRVSFLNEDGSDRVPAVTPIRAVSLNGTDATPDVPPPAYVSPREQPHGTNGYSASDAKKGLATSSEHAKPSASRSASTTATTSATDKDATITTLKAKLAENEALIASLRLIAAQRNKDSGLKQRAGAAVSTGTSEKAPAGSAKPADARAAPQLDQVARRGTEGVPVQVTALLCLLSFLLAYLFF